MEGALIFKILVHNALTGELVNSFCAGYSHCVIGLVCPGGGRRTHQNRWMRRPRPKPKPKPAGKVSLGDTDPPLLNGESLPARHCCFHGCRPHYATATRIPRAHVRVCGACERDVVGATFLILKRISIHRVCLVVVVHVAFVSSLYFIHASCYTINICLPHSASLARSVKHREKLVTEKQLSSPKSNHAQLINHLSMNQD